MKSYHFTKNILDNFDSFHKYLKDCNAIVCFDFEDSISIGIKGSLIDAKNEYRDKLIYDIKKCISKVNFLELGFRINKVSSANYLADIKAFNLLRGVECVFIPKVECGRELRKVFADINIPVNEIIPIIETKKGFENLLEIIAIKDIRFKKIAFGHCDYNLSIGNFPFFHQNSNEYWKWILILNEACEKLNLEIINSPVLELNNNQLMINNLRMCAEFSKVTGQITLSKKQTEICSKQTINNEIHSNHIDNDCFSLTSKKDIMESFEKYRLEGKSFAIDSKRRIISPQEYQMASALNKFI